MRNNWEQLRDIGPQIEERPHRHRKVLSGKKTFAIESRYTGTMLWLIDTGEWRVHRRYKTEKQRDKALSNLQNKNNNWEYRSEQDAKGR